MDKSAKSDRSSTVARRRIGTRPIELSVVIPCYNGAATLEETLEGLVTQRWARPWEIVLSDNGSTDASVAIFESYARAHPEIPMRVADASDRRGRSHAANAGVAAARGGAIAFCDADDVPAPGWLAAMGEALRHHDIVAGQVEHRKLNPGWVGTYRGGSTSGLGRLPFPPYCLYTGGGSMGVRKAAFEAIGGFDHAYPVAQDLEFCVRAALRGYTIVSVPEAVIHVRFRDDLDALYRQAFSYGKYEIKLAKQYRASGPTPGGRWGHFLRTWTALLRWQIAKTLLGRPESMADRAKRQWKLGLEMGQLAGMLAYRSPPNHCEALLPPAPPAPVIRGRTPAVRRSRPSRMLP